MNRHTAVRERSAGKPNSIAAKPLCRLYAFFSSAPGQVQNSTIPKFQNSKIPKFHNSRFSTLKVTLRTVRLVNKIVLNLL